MKTLICYKGKSFILQDMTEKQKKQFKSENPEFYKEVFEEKETETESTEQEVKQENEATNEATENV